MNFTFSINILVTFRSRMIMKRSDSTKVVWTAYLGLFAFDIWGSLLLMLLILSSCITFTNWAYLTLLPKKSYEIPHEPFGVIALSVFGSLCNQGKKHSSFLYGAKITSFSTFLTLTLSDGA